MCYQPTPRGALVVGGGYYVDRLADATEVVTLVSAAGEVAVVRGRSGAEMVVPATRLSPVPADDFYRELRGSPGASVMPLRPVAIPPDTLERLAAIDARCDWMVTRGTQRSDRVYFCRVWERGKERDYLEGGPSKFYRSTLADALRAIVLAAEDRGWNRPK